MYKTKETAIRNLQKGKNFGTKPFDLFRNDRDVVLEAIKINPHFIRNADEQFRSDRNIMLYISRANTSLFQYSSASLKNDKAYCMEVIRLNGYLISEVSEELRKDKEVALVAIKEDEDALYFTDDEIQALCKGKDPVLALEAAIRQGNFQEKLKTKPHSHSPKLKM